MNPQKYLMQDILNRSPPFDVWLQGNITEIVNDDIILSDSTGKVKITDCHRTRDAAIGTYCCVIGVAVETTGIPEIKPSKFFTIRSLHEKSWETEVKEAQLLLKGKVAPEI